MVIIKLCSLNVKILIVNYIIYYSWDILEIYFICYIKEIILKQLFCKRVKVSLLPCSESTNYAAITGNCCNILLRIFKQISYLSKISRWTICGPSLESPVFIQYWSWKETFRWKRFYTGLEDRELVFQQHTKNRFSICQPQSTRFHC